MIFLHKKSSLFVLNKILLILFFLVFINVFTSTYALSAGPFTQGLIDANDQIVSGDDALLQGFRADSILESIINWILGLAAIITTGVIIWGGVMYILSFGDESKAERAKRIIFYAVIGLILVGGSFIIVRMVKQILSA